MLRGFDSLCVERADNTASAMVEDVILGGSGDVAFDDEMIEECLNFWDAYFLWVAFTVRQACDA